MENCSCWGRPKDEFGGFLLGWGILGGDNFFFDVIDFWCCKKKDKDTYISKDKTTFKVQISMMRPFFGVDRQRLLSGHSEIKFLSAINTIIIIMIIIIIIYSAISIKKN